MNTQMELDPELKRILSEVEKESIEASSKVEIEITLLDHDEDDEELNFAQFLAKDKVFGLEVLRDSEELAESDLRKMLVSIFYENSKERKQVLFD